MLEALYFRSPCSDFGDLVLVRKLRNLSLLFVQNPRTFLKNRKMPFNQKGLISYCSNQWVRGHKSGVISHHVLPLHILFYTFSQIFAPLNRKKHFSRSEILKNLDMYPPKDRQQNGHYSPTFLEQRGLKIIFKH